MIYDSFNKIVLCMEILDTAQGVLNALPDADETFLEPVIDLITKMAKAINKTAIDATYECQHCHGEIPHGHSRDCIAFDCEIYLKKQECKCVRKIMIQELNTFPYGETIEFTKCADCGKELI